MTQRQVRKLLTREPTASRWLAGLAVPKHTALLRNVLQLWSWSEACYPVWSLSYPIKRKSTDMVEDWLAVINNMNGAVNGLRHAAPEVMKTFGEMARAAHSGNALDNKTKELVALAISVSTRCTPCIAYHTEGAIKQGASREAIAEVLAMAIYMGAGPSVMYAAQALEAADQLGAKASKPA